MKLSDILNLLKWVSLQIRSNPATTVALFSITFNVLLVYYIITGESRQGVQLLNCEAALRECQIGRDRQRDFYQSEMKDRYKELKAERDSANAWLYRLKNKNVN